VKLILALSGSPVDGSSTDYLTRVLAESTAQGLATEGLEAKHRFIRLADLQFIPCQACGRAPEPGLFCLFDDDLTDIYADLARCDCLVVGSPVYFDSVSAQTKAFIDRCNCFRPPDWDNQLENHDFVKLLTRKRPGAMVLVGGERGWFEGARRVIAGLFRWIEVTNEGALVYRSSDFRAKGTAASDEDIKRELQQLAVRLADKVREQS
jgi:multimeric flavodoxin WrbA